MKDFNSAWRQFEGLVEQLLELKGFEVDAHQPRGDRGFDFVGRRGGENWAIEVKFYKTPRAQPALLEAAASRLVNNGILAQSKRGMLVVSCVVPMNLRRSLRHKFNIVLVDRMHLRAWAADYPELASQLDAIAEIDPVAQLDVIASGDDPGLDVGSLEFATPSVLDTKGGELCARLRSLGRGRSTWAKYEEVCAEILAYLFPNDLQGWHKQLRTDDGLNRFDFICRIRPSTEFWRFVIDHLNSRYVLFEFKNYSAKIKQDQILTTERYLLENGLRKLAIVFSRTGADENAIRVAKGAMRESGKLLLVIDDEMVCRMLHMKQNGEDPTDSLFELADDFLLKLTR